MIPESPYRRDRLAPHVIIILIQFSLLVYYFSYLFDKREINVFNKIDKKESQRRLRVKSSGS